jgi:predicted RNA binding protein YcfA (HicA-like mRNA interferase family)
MSRRKKLLQKLRQNPQTVSFEQLENMLSYFGFERVGGQGSHRVYEHLNSGRRLTIVYRRPHVKMVYVKALIQLIDELGLDGHLSDEEDLEDGPDSFSSEI